MNLRSERVRNTGRQVYCLIWAAMSAFLFPGFISDQSTFFSNSIFSAVFFVAVFLLLNYESGKKTNRRKIIFSHILGFLLSVMTAFGYSLDVKGEVCFRCLLPGILIFTHVIAQIVSILWRILEKENKTDEKGRQWLIFQKPLLLFAIFLVCWTPVFIAEYPGGFRYDATEELEQLTNGFNGNFPLLHSAVLALLFPPVYRLTGTYDVAVTIYVLLQMVLISALFTHMIMTFARKGIHRYLLIYAFLYCALFPVIHILVVQELRDVLFGSLLTYLVFCFYRMSTDKELVLKSKIKPVLIALVMNLTLFARNNNTGKTLMILVIAVCILVWLINRKKYLYGVTLFSVSGILFFFFLNWILTAICQPMVISPSKATPLSVFSQTIARTYVQERETWTEAELSEVNEYMNMEDICYVPEYGDSTKNRIRADVNIRNFASFWLRMGLKHPGCYANAFLAHTQNMWFPPSVIDGYKQYFKNEGQPYYEWDKSYFSITKTNAEPISHQNLWPSVLDFYTGIGLRISFEKIPVISLLFSIGFHFWLLLFAALYLWYRKAYKLLLPTGILLLYMLVTAFAPLVILRYYAAVFFCHPMILIFLIQPEHAACENKEINVKSKRKGTPGVC